MILIPLVFINYLWNNPRIGVHTAKKGTCGNNLKQNHDWSCNLWIEWKKNDSVSDINGRDLNNEEGEEKGINRWTIFDIELFTHKERLQSLIYSMSLDESYL